VFETRPLDQAAGEASAHDSLVGGTYDVRHVLFDSETAPGVLSDPLSVPASMLMIRSTSPPDAGDVFIQRRCLGRAHHIDPGRDLAAGREDPAVAGSAG